MLFGRPTVVSNTETIAHLALIARHGAAWFREAGDESTPGSTLVTLAGGVATPGTVVELVGQPTMREVLSRLGGLNTAPAAVLVGGYAGNWVAGPAALGTPLGRARWPHAGRGSVAVSSACCLPTPAG